LNVGHLHGSIKRAFGYQQLVLIPFPAAFSIQRSCFDATIEYI